MNPFKTRGLTAALLLSPLIPGCASSRTPDPAPVPAAAPSTSAAAIPAATPAMPVDHSQHMMGMPAMAPIPAGALHTAADVHFMQGMIAHHGQAIHMSRLAASRGASPRLLRFAQKIDQSQEVEIRQMQDWLRAYDQVAPDAESWRTMSMPGMLTAEELATLTAATGAEFDKQFLTLMIKHHQGALKMVADLFATPRAAQDVDVSVFANDVENTQTAEIGLMLQMLSDYRDHNGSFIR